MATRRSSAAKGAKPKAAKSSKQKRGSSAAEERGAHNPEVGRSTRPPATTKHANTKGVDGLTDQQRLFVTEYLKDNNATQAAVRAGYAPETARQQGSRLLTNVVIRAAVNSHQNEVLAKVQEETGITLQRTLREIARIAYFDPRRMFTKNGNPLDIIDLDDDTAAVIAGLDVLEEFDGTGRDRVKTGEVKKWKLADKKGALDMLMKHLGGYKVDNEQTGTATAGALAEFLSGLRDGGAGGIQVAKKARA